MGTVIRNIYGLSSSLGGLFIKHHDTDVGHRWSHAACIIDTKGKDPFVVEAMWKTGVQCVSLHQFVSRYKRTCIVHVEVPDAAAGDWWACQAIGQPYDYLAVLGKLFRKSWDEEGSWQCAEFVERRMQIAGLNRFRDTPSRITPNLSFSNLCGTLTTESYL